MTDYLHIAVTSFALIPLLGFILSLLIPDKSEVVLSRVSFITAGLQLVLSFCFVACWSIFYAQPINIKEVSLYKSVGYEFFIDIYFDHITAVYLILGSFLTFLITIYSRYYLHREVGYKRFFNTILFFYFGYNIIILSGNFETLLFGWEVLGLSSFLLIAFYRNRYLPVRNAFKVFSLYRLADICIILAMWMSHHLWQHNVTFFELNNSLLVGNELKDHQVEGIFISIMILVAACVKSAQIPFSPWLPRAMEGPTPSSAIFYGSLAVHIGAFILLRTFPFWESITLVRLMVGFIGAITSIVASATSRVQSTVKSQIAYSSISQIGLIFIEIALGFEILALIHIASNAFLRSYQLLVSPSVVTYLLKEQFYKFNPTERSKGKIVFDVIRFSLYVLSIREWNLDSILFRYLWNPFKKIGKLFHFVNGKITVLILIPAFFISLFILLMGGGILSQKLHLFPYILASVACVLSIRAFVERKHPRFSFILVAFSHFWVALAVSFNEHFSFSHTVIYLSGVTVSLIIGLIVLYRLGRLEKHVDLNKFYGHIQDHSTLGFVFLLASLGLAGFPVTPTFLGEDLIFSHIHENQIWLTILVALSAIFNGLSTIRIYIRVFLGPSGNNNHQIANRSS
ncbi:MAG: proton-conducting transporter membrane subunit [Cyclobacteriaceae bacterium]